MIKIQQPFSSILNQGQNEVSILANYCKKAGFAQLDSARPGHYHINGQRHWDWMCAGPGLLLRLRMTHSDVRSEWLRPGSNSTDTTATSEVK